MPHAQASGFPSPSFRASQPARRPARRHHPCRSRSSEALACLPSTPDPFVIRRSQTTEHAPFIVGRGPVPRHATIAGDRPPRYGCQDRPRFIVWRGPVPRHRSRNPSIAGDRPPRYGKKTPPLHVGRGPVPRHANNERCLRSLGLEDLNVYSSSRHDEPKVL